jgi:hypothetical protein
MQAYSVSLKFVKMTNMTIDVSSLYLLAAPNTPDEVREQAVERSERGESLSHQKVRDLMTAAKLAERREAARLRSERWRRAWHHAKTARAKAMACGRLLALDMVQAACQSPERSRSDRNIRASRALRGAIASRASGSRPVPCGDGGDYRRTGASIAELRYAVSPPRVIQALARVRHCNGDWLCGYGLAFFLPVSG